MELDPGFALVYYNRGYVYNSNGEQDKAVADYTRLMEISPKLALAYYNRGYAYYKKGENAKAEADFKKARDLAYIVVP